MSIAVDAGQMDMLTNLLALVATLSPSADGPRPLASSDRASVRIEVSIRAQLPLVKGATVYVQGGYAVPVVVQDKMIDGHPIRILSVE